MPHTNYDPNIAAKALREYAHTEPGLSGHDIHQYGILADLIGFEWGHRSAQILSGRKFPKSVIESEVFYPIPEPRRLGGTAMSNEVAMQKEEEF